MSLAKFAAQAAQYGGKHGGKIAGGAAGLGALGAGVYAGQPYIDDWMTDQAIESMGRQAKSGIMDALEFAEEHPYITATALTGAGALGAKLGDEGFRGLLDSINPLMQQRGGGGGGGRRRRN